MKLAYILNTYPEGSHTFIRREIAALERRGFDVLRFAMRKPSGALVDPLDRAEQAKTHFVLEQGAPALFGALARQSVSNLSPVLRAVRLAWSGARRADRGALRHAAYFAEACHLARRFQSAGVQHIHAHFGTNAATVAMLAGTLTGIPFSFTVHGPEEFDRPEALDLPEKLRRSAFAIAVSQFGRSQLCRWVDSELWGRIKVVHCGIDPADFDGPSSLPQEKRLVCIGRFAEQKGHMALIEAMALLGDADPGLKLVLVGDGPMRGTVERAIQEHGLGEKVEITGWLDSAGVRRELARAQALVMPSFAEGLPVAIMEAMAMQRPVIATYIAGIPELVRPGETGWLVPAGDAQALAEAMRDLAAAPLDRLEEMGSHARARALERHNIDTEAERLASLFEASVAGG